MYCYCIWWINEDRRIITQGSQASLAVRMQTSNEEEMHDDDWEIMLADEADSSVDRSSQGAFDEL